MALVNTPASNLFLELDGQAAGALRTAQPASLRVDLVPHDVGRELVVRRSARVALGEMAAESTVLDNSALTDWVAAVLAGNLSPHDGAVLVADRNYTVQRRIGFRGARLTRLAWPALDARAGKQPVTLSLRWLVDMVDDGPGGGQKTQLASRRKALLASNFRVGGLPFDGAAVTKVELPVLQVTWSSSRTGDLRDRQLDGRAQLGPLAITVSARQAEAARAWVRKLVVDGSIDEAEGFALQVELLDATLKKVMATITFSSCLLLGMDEDPLANDDRLSELVLRFDVAGMKFSLA